MELSSEERRRAFSWWLRTGFWPAVRTADGTELKFNPYHDSQDGRFTFGPGGGGGSAKEALRRTTRRSDGTASLAASGPEPDVGRGSNSRAFEDPMTLERSFPGLSKSPSGAVVAVADNLFDFTGPADAMTTEVLQDQAKQLSSQIKAVNPGWHYDEINPTDALGNPIHTVQGLTAKVNDLRFQRAVAIAWVKGDYEPLQVETLRFAQQRTDQAYDQGLALQRAGRLTPRLSDQEALGNYIDREVRNGLRERYNQLGVDSAGTGPVRVNRRENDSSGTDLTYRRPDARVKDVAFDVTLTRKTLGTAQVRGFFNADFRPSRVIIIRPRKLGADYTYAIPRPETRR